MSSKRGRPSGAALMRRAAAGGDIDRERDTTAVDSSQRHYDTRSSSTSAAPQRHLRVVAEGRVGGGAAVDGLTDGRHRQRLKLAARWLDTMRDMVEGIVAQYTVLGRDDRATLWTQQ